MLGAMRLELETSEGAGAGFAAKEPIGVAGAPEAVCNLHVFQDLVSFL